MLNAFPGSLGNFSLIPNPDIWVLKPVVAPASRQNKTILIFPSGDGSSCLTSLVTSLKEQPANIRNADSDKKVRCIWLTLRISRRTTQAMIAQETEVRAAPSAWFAGRTEPTAQTVLRRYQRVRRVMPAVAGGVRTAYRAEMGDEPSPRCRS